MFYKNKHKKGLPEKFHLCLEHSCSLRDRRNQMFNKYVGCGARHAYGIKYLKAGGFLNIGMSLYFRI